LASYKHFVQTGHRISHPRWKNDRISFHKKDISKLLNEWGHIHEKNPILWSSYSFFISQLHNFLQVSQNIYQLHNFCQIHVSLFRPGYYFPLLGDEGLFYQNNGIHMIFTSKYICSLKKMLSSHNSRVILLCGLFKNDCHSDKPSSKMRDLPLNILNIFGITLIFAKVKFLFIVICPNLCKFGRSIYNIGWIPANLSKPLHFFPIYYDLVDSQMCCWHLGMNKKVHWYHKIFRNVATIRTTMTP